MTTKQQIVLSLGVAWCLVACSGLADVPSVPPIPHTAAGVAQAVAAAYSQMSGTLGDFIVATGVFTDELTDSSATFQALDKRTLDGTNLDDLTGAYASLQNTRVSADVAARSLAVLLPQAPPDGRGSMYAVQGYTEVMLADLFCSGIPLSTLNLDNAKVLYQAGLPRDSVYRRAIVHFDSTLALSTTNDSLMTLARVGKGRALLALGQFTEAAQAVASVADGAHYKIGIGFPTTPQNPIQAVFSKEPVADREGHVGLPYLSSHDPRTLSTRVSSTTGLYIPNKYLSPDSVVQYIYSGYIIYTRLMLADWVEARLIQAEAALHANDVTTWLQTLNHLRDVAADSNAFQGIYPSITLAPLTDPGTPVTRINLMFAERAAWLYLTGHRQGDARRLIRQYGHTQNDVYPNGVYAHGGTYGTSVVAPIPSTEQANPKFTGCIDRLP